MAFSISSNDSDRNICSAWCTTRKLAIMGHGRIGNFECGFVGFYIIPLDVKVQADPNELRQS